MRARSTDRRCSPRSPIAAAALAGLAVGALVAGPAPAPAQEGQGAAADTLEMPDPEAPRGENLEVPEGWRFRLDSPSEGTDLAAAEEPASGDIRFVNMTPGWHVTTGPRVILYHPAARAEGDYRATVTMHLFPPGQRNEAYGLFVGGRELQGADQRYLYFLIRRSGDYLVKVRDGSSTREIVGWTSHDAVVPFTDETEETATNTLSLTARGDSIRFSVNGVEVDAVARDGLPVDGQVGWRVNHMLDLHVSEYSIEDLD